jgi:hypothetical protein
MKHGSVIHYMPEMKDESKQWTSPGKQAPKKANTVTSAGKVMATVFWDSKGKIFIDYLEKGRTITGQYYDQLWGKFDDALKEKWPHLARKKVLSTKSMRQHTDPSLPQPNWWN